ncbi:MAG: DUF2634 domain-containing protein [Clostridia bacterium]|jgi:hypothetical protein|nr:DUF2634 domain-containing protein [Clostridia bacterium]
MSIDIFPAISQNSDTSETSEVTYKDIKWNFETDKPVFKNGEPVYVSGNEALKTWIWNALKTERKMWEIWTWNYGNDIFSLIGKPFSADVKNTEVARMTEECLLVNPYIISVDNIDVNFSDDNLTISLSITTIYGKIEMEV